MADPSRAGAAMTAAARWSARVLALVVAGTVAALFIGTAESGLPKPDIQEAGLMITFLTACAGLIVGWRRELLGGLMTTTGIGLFYLIHWMPEHRFPSGWAFAAILLPGLLFLWCGLQKRGSPRDASEGPSGA